MSINWTGSGSFLLHKQRRKQDFARNRRRHASIDNDGDEWLPNTRGGHIVPSEYARSPTPELQADAAGKLRHDRRDTNPQAGGRGCSLSREAKDPPSQPARKRSRLEAQGASFNERRSWLLNQQDWVGAKQAQKRREGEAEQTAQQISAKAQPSPAPILDSNNHSK